MYGVILFYATQEAMKAEALAQQQALKVRIIPTPESIFASCGFSLKFDLEEEERLLALFNHEKIQYDTVYHANRQGLAVTYEKIKENQRDG